MYNDPDDDTRKADEDYMRSLYERFRKEVESGSPIDYYEIDELLDIYDYAQDEGDAMVQMYVFLTASRLYPASKDFDERMAFFLSYISQEAADEMFERAGRRDSPLWDVLRMGVRCFPSGNPEPYLKQILSRYDRLDCESTLKIIDLLRDMDRRDLLVKYFPALRDKAEDPRGFSFEVAETVREDSTHLPAARQIAEDLTAQEPFNIDAWLLLARMELTLENPAEALAAVDYALAIDPQNANARLTRAVVMVVIDDRRSEAIEALEEILKQTPDNPFALEGLAEAYAREAAHEKAAEIYSRIISRGLTLASGGDPIYALVDLDLTASQLAAHLHRIITSGAGSHDSDWWQQLLDHLTSQGKDTRALQLVEILDKEIGHRWDSFYLDLLYRTGNFLRYEKIFMRIASEAQTRHEMPDYLTLTHFLMLAASYLRSGQAAKAIEVCQMIEKKQQECRTLDERLHLRGIRFTARLIITVASADPLPDNIADFDPLSSPLDEA